MRALAAIGLLMSVWAMGCAPAALTQDQVVPAFIAASQAGTRTMHVEWHGTMNQQSLSGAFDFNGPDYAGSITTAVAQGGGANQISYARVGGVSFVNYSESGWQNAGKTELDPLYGLTETGVAYEALDTLDGQQVHRLRVHDLAASAGLFDQTAFLGTPATLIDPSDYLIFVNTTGIPVGAHLALDFVIPSPIDAASTALEYQLQVDFEFSLWGEPVTISAPDVTNNGGIDFPPPPRVQRSF